MKARLSLFLLWMASVIVAFLAGGWFFGGSPGPIPPAPTAAATAPSPRPPEENPSPRSPGPERPQASTSAALSANTYNALRDELVRLAKTDPGEAFRRIAELPDKATQSALRQSVATVALKEDFSRLGAVMALVQDSMEFQLVFNAVVPEQYRKDPEKTLATIRAALQGRQRNDALRWAMTAALQQRDWAGAIAVHASLPNSDERRNGTGAIASALAQADPARAFQWLDTLRGEEEIRTASDRLKYTLMESRNNPMLQQMLARTERPSEREGIIRNISSNFVKSPDPAALQAFMASLKPGEADQVRAMQILGDSTLSFAEKARQGDAIEGLQARADTLAALIGREVSKDPVAAAATMMSQPEKIQETMAPNLVLAWARIDADAAVAWLQKLPPGTLQNRTAYTFAQHLRFTDKAMARGVAELISDPEKRAQILTEINR